MGLGASCSAWRTHSSNWWATPLLEQVVEGVGEVTSPGGVGACQPYFQELLLLTGLQSAARQHDPHCDGVHP